MLLVAAICLLPQRAEAQNDWQYPDPYFGILEFEKSHDASAWRRYRAEVAPAPRRNTGTSTDRGLAPPENPAAPRANRFRWRAKPRR